MVAYVQVHRCLSKYDNAASPGLQSPPSTRHPENEPGFTALGGRAGLHLAPRPQRGGISIRLVEGKGRSFTPLAPRLQPVVGAGWL